MDQIDLLYRARLVSIDNFMFSSNSAAQRTQWLQSKIDDPSEGKRSESKSPVGHIALLLWFFFFFAKPKIYKCDFIFSSRNLFGASLAKMFRKKCFCSISIFSRICRD